MSEARQEPQIWTDPGAASLYAVAVITACLWAFGTGMVRSEAAPLLIPPMLSAGVTPLVCGIIDLKRGNIISGTLSMVFGGILGFGGVAQFGVMAWLGSQKIPFDPRLSGYMWGMAGVVMILISIVALRAPRAIFLGILEVGIGLLLSGVSMLGIAPVLGPLSSWMFLVFSAWCLYTGTAILTNNMALRTVLPLGGPLIKGHMTAVPHVSGPSAIMGDK